ncbi:hypothetical protein MOQ_005781, partial [Trypanosoma cruzi marinkellei]
MKKLLGGRPRRYEDVYLPLSHHPEVVSPCQFAQWTKGETPQRRRRQQQQQQEEEEERKKKNSRCVFLPINVCIRLSVLLYVFVAVAF